MLIASSSGLAISLSRLLTSNGVEEIGQKVQPIGIRLGIVKEHTSVWYADGRTYADYLFADLKVREYLQDKLKSASVSRIDIHRPAQTARITIHTARPGIVIGKKGEDVEKLRQDLTKQMGVPVHINIEEIRKPELDGMLVAQSVAQQLERRVMFRRAMKRAVQNAMRIGAKGIKIQVSGRLGGAEIARTEWYREGRVPLHTLRADIDYGTSEASTTYGIIGVKVWVYKGDTLGRNDLPAAVEPRAEEERRPRGPRRDDRGARPGSDRPAPRGARRPVGVNAAPADGSDKPSEAAVADATKPAVKRVRKVAAPAAAADGKGE